jgi:hypothetical protein
MPTGVKRETNPLCGLVIYLKRIRMKKLNIFLLIWLVVLFLSIFTGCATVQGKEKQNFSSFAIGDKKLDLYALLESSEESHERWKLLSINVAKISNDGKYIAIGSSEKILQSAIDENGNNATEWVGTGMVTILDSDGNILYRLNDEQQYDQLKTAQKNFISKLIKLDEMMNNNEPGTEVEKELRWLEMYRDKSAYLFGADMGIGFLEFTPNEYIISAPRQLKRGSPVLDWVISWSLKTGEMKWSYRAGFGGIKSLELIEDGSKIKVIDMWDRVTIINTDTGRE